MFAGPGVVLSIPELKGVSFRDFQDVHVEHLEICWLCSINLFGYNSLNMLTFSVLRINARELFSSNLKVVAKCGLCSNCSQKVDVLTLACSDFC